MKRLRSSSVSTASSVAGACAVGCEVGKGAAQERDGAGCLLVGEHLDVGEPGGIVVGSVRFSA